MHYKKIFSILSISICLNIGSLFGNYAFKKKVKSVCKSYRISVQSSQLSLQGDEYSINMESGRNNFEMFMLVGFASAGQAIAHQKEMGLTDGLIRFSIGLDNDIERTFNAMKDCMIKIGIVKK